MTHSFVLVFDTSGPYCAAALRSGDSVVARVDDMARGQAEHLLPMLEQMLDEAALNWRDLDAIGVGVGPGNFTGIRIAVSAARGLAMALQIPCLGVSTFETTQQLGQWAQTLVPGPQGKFYHYDPDKMDRPGFDDVHDFSGWVRSDSFPVDDHIRALLDVVVRTAGPDTPPPKPLYVKPADAAPPREQAPVILP